MSLLHVETPVHGRVLFERLPGDCLLVGFHGYAETAETHFAELVKIPGIGEWSIAAVQALHPFYVKGGSVVAASWMTSQDRELAIADNIRYVRHVLTALPAASTTVFLGFSQGVAMAARAAASIGCAGLICLGSDIPPDVDAARLPPTLLARGTRDDWYTSEKFKKDLSLLPNATALELDAGHEWTDAFRTAAGEFLNSLTRSRST
jgi:predicted esterase